MTTLYRNADGTLTALTARSVVTINGQTWSAGAASRVFPVTDLAAAGLLLEHREENQGDGFEDPAVGTDAEGAPCVWVRAVAMTPDRALYKATLTIMAEAEAMQLAAVEPYAWPEAAAWVPLETQARAYLEDPTAPVGLDLAADCGPDADAAETDQRARRIIANADSLRHTAGQIKRWRRTSLAALESCAAQGGTREAIDAVLAELLEQGVTWAEPTTEPQQDIDPPPADPDPNTGEETPEPGLDPVTVDPYA
jgi:hypothetical protein